MKLLFNFCIFLMLPVAAHLQPKFTRIDDTSNPAVTFTNTFGAYKGVGWIDLDGDNFTDLSISPHFLFKNLGNGQFEQIQNIEGVSTTGQVSGLSWGDIDNDGYPDMISSGNVSGVHMNNGDQSFDPAAVNLPNFNNYSSWDCAVADADNNGLLDLLFVHAQNFHQFGPFPCRLYLQVAPDSFEQITGYEFTDNLAPYTIPRWADFDLDGDVDLFIGSGPAGTQGPDFAYRNLTVENGGTFELERMTDAPFDQLQDGQTYNFPDVDNDGDLDICLTNYSGAKNRYWIQTSPGVYALTQAPFSLIGGHLSNVWGDVDNDGDLDMLLSVDGNNLVRLYLNNGDGSYAAPLQAGFAGAGVCSIALADYDNDGDLDFYTNGSGNARSLFRNDELSEGNRWVHISLEGTTSNRSAIGATVRLKATINGEETWQIRQVEANNTFCGHSDQRQHFGLGDATQVDSLIIQWPSGLEETYTVLFANNFYRAAEGLGILSNSSTDIVSEGNNNLKVFPNPASNWLYIEDQIGIDKNSSPWRIYTIEGKEVMEGLGFPIEISMLPNGLYSIQTEKGLNSLFIIQDQ